MKGMMPPAATANSSGTREDAEAPPRADTARRIEELGRIIMAYSEVTEKLQQSHDQLKQTVQSLRNELSEKNRLLERKNRLAALGEMAAGMAHEIRNPLGGIQLYASILAQDVADRPGPAATVKKISAGVKRLESLVSQVLQFSRDIAVNSAEMDLAECVDQAVDLAADSLQARAIACTVNGPRPLNVVADPLLVGQAVLNLVLNAAEAMGDGGRLAIEFGPSIGLGEARQFNLLICDSGPGIPAAILDRIFNPFFTTKDNGTGLGLAIVHRVVEAHDGTITATNVEDENGNISGAKFEIRI